jgi:hypothetical protein
LVDTRWKANYPRSTMPSSNITFRFDYAAIPDGLAGLRD